MFFAITLTRSVWPTSAPATCRSAAATAPAAWVHSAPRGVAAQPFVFVGDRFGARPFSARRGQQLARGRRARDFRRFGVARRDAEHFTGGRRFLFGRAGDVFRGHDDAHGMCPASAFVSVYFDSSAPAMFRAPGPGGGAPLPAERVGDRFGPGPVAFVRGQRLPGDGEAEHGRRDQVFGPDPATVAVGADWLRLCPPRFFAITLTRSVWPTSAPATM